MARTTTPVFLLAATLAAQPAFAGVLNDDLGLTWASRRDLTDSQFSTHFNDYRDRGYIITDVDGYPHGGDTRYSMVWRDNTDNRGWAEWRNLTSDGYHEKWEEYRDRGYRPLDVEAYQFAGQTRYAGIWVENREGLGWYSYRNLTSSEYADRFRERRDEGYRLVDMEAYQTSSGLRYAAIWVQNRDNIGWAQLRDMTRTQYQEEITTRAADGYRVIDYESYRTSSGQRYAAIWEQNVNGRGWVLRSDRTEVIFANYWREYRDKGYRLVDFERYETPNGTRYAGLWMENEPSRLRYNRKLNLDTLIEGYREGNNLPGISVAIIRNSTMIYRRGFGRADLDSNKAAHGETVYLSASVSKAIGGTLAAKLEAAGQLTDGTPISLDLTQPTSTFLSNIPIWWIFSASIPDHHTHTVDQLLSHSACIWHYDGGPQPPTQFYSTSVAAVMTMWNGQLLNNCTVGASWNYSTHAFTFAAAAIERATGRPIDRLLDEEIVAPHGLTSMRVQFAERNLPPNYERAVPYNNNNNATSYDDNSWKVLGGGIEVSAVDLARFGWKTLSGQIVGAATRDNRMWTPVVAGRTTGLGWTVTTSGRRRVAQHGGSWTGARSYLRVYRDDGLVIAIMSNRTNHTNDDVFDLATDIANIVLAP